VPSALKVSVPCAAPVSSTAVSGAWLASLSLASTLPKMADGASSFKA
jgi:hypothetical protein